MVKLYPKDRERIAKVEQYEAGRRLLRRKGERASTRKAYARSALMFSEFLGKNLDEIVDEYKKDADENLFKTFDKWEMIFEDFADHLKERFPEGSTAATHFAGAVALINANVPRSAEITPKGPEAHSRSIKPIIIEDLRTVRSVADARERAFIDFLKDTGMSRADAVTVTYGQVKNALENPSVEYHKLDVYRGKENVEYETWLGPNALKSLRLYFKVRRPSGEEVTDDSAIFATKHSSRKAITPQTLSGMLRRLGRKVGIDLSPHRLRKFFETYITTGGVHPIVAKYWMGHEIKGGKSDIEAAYIIPPLNVQRDEYVKAYNKIDLEPTSLAELQKRQQIVEELQSKIMAGQPLTDEDFSIAKRYNIRFVARHQRHMEKSVKEAKDCADGEHCERFEEITENELLSYLRQGWRVAHKLENGRVIVKK